MTMFRKVAFAALLALPAACGEGSAGEVAIVEPWARETVAGVGVSAGYGRLVNATRADVRLVGAETPVAERIELHEVIDDEGVMRMRELSAGLPVAAGETVTLRPGGYHMMLLDLRQPLRAGETIPVTLRFADGGTVEAAFAVRSAADAAHGGGHE